MLTNVYVKNFALIEETEVEFKKGFNILTGETGAGKSIIIGSINYCLGAKAEKDVIREGAEYALVELTFLVDDKNTLSQIKALDIIPEEDGTLVLTRRIQPQRSVFKVNGESVTAKQMRELAALLIDIHGQHDHQSLLSEKRQKELLDDFAGEELRKVTDELSVIYSDIQSLEKEIEAYDIDENQRQRDISLAQYEVDEIENANLIIGEEEELNKKHNLMANAVKVMKGLTVARNCLSGDDNGALNSLGFAVREMNMMPSISEEINNICQHLSDAEQVVMEVHREILDYMDELNFDDEEYNEVENRIDVINRLSLKYGSTVEEILKYGEKRKEELNKLIDGADFIERLKLNRDKLLQKYVKLADKAHDIREKVALGLAKDITESLEELNFLKVNFEIALEKNADVSGYGPDGFDRVSFMISLNPGEKLKALRDVASGGELSRVMLSLKTVLASRDNIDTLIFDEIDTGISGITAWQVSRKIGQLSKQHQIICITHLPQIAAMSDTHFMISKHEKNGRTVTELSLVEGDAHVNEIARLLGSENITDAVRANAIDLLKQAGKE